MNTPIQVYKQKPKDFLPKIEVVATYLSVNGKLLFLKLCSAKQEAGFWGVPAGKLEVGEDPIHGAKRELWEETGIDIDAQAFHSLSKLFMRKPEMDYIYHLFGVKLTKEPLVHLSREHCAYKWVCQEEIEKLPLMKGAHVALEAYYKK